MSAAGAMAPQTNGAPPSSAPQAHPSTQPPQSQPAPSSQAPATTAPPQSQPPASQPAPQNPVQNAPQPATTAATAATTTAAAAANPSAAPRPRDARTIELLLTAQGVTSFEQRVPLLLLDFAYRHTASVLSDALHLSADPYTTHAGARPSGAAGAAPVNVGEATLSANAVRLAIASRLNFQFHGGGASKDWMMELAREKNKIALPRVSPSEWGVRLPGERFVLSGVSWGLRDVWAGQEGTEESSDEDEDEMMADGPGGAGGEGKGADAMEVETEDVGGDGVEGGTIGDVFGDEGLEDEEMAEA